MLGDIKAVSACDGSYSINCEYISDYSPLCCFSSTIASFVTQNQQEKTKCPKEYFVIFMSLILALAFLAGIGAVVMCNIIGFIFPAIKSIKAIETHASTEVTQWLVYWVVYASFSVIEIFADTLTYWIPFYYRFKLGFLLWAMLVSEPK